MLAIRAMVIRWLTSSAVKVGLLYTVRGLSLVISALDGVLENPELSDSAKAQIEGAISVLSSAQRFLIKFSGIIGVSTVPASQSLKGASSLDELSNLIDSCTEKL